MAKKLRDMAAAMAAKDSVLKTLEEKRMSLLDLSILMV
jgi:hypothetical protein